MAKHRLALIGYGGMAGWHHENIAKRIPEIEVVGAYDIRPEQLKKAKANGLLAYPTLESLLKDSSIDLVTVATPNDVHKELCIRAMESGKHVVSEKPVTLNSQELRDIMAVRDRTGKVFSIHHNRRWDKDYLTVKTAIEQNLIGRPYFIESRVLGSRGESMFGWRAHKQNGGGMLLDWGVHLIDQALQMVDSPVTSVDAHLQQVFGDEVDDNIKLLLRFENGLSYLMEMATNCFIHQPRWHVTGTGGTLVVEDWACKGNIVTLKPDSEMVWDEDIVYTEAGPTRTMAPRPRETTLEIPLPKVLTNWTDFYRNIVDVLDKGAELLVKPEQALRVMQVIDLLFESERVGHGLRCRI